jgi:pyruvate,water dikinase
VIDYQFIEPGAESGDVWERSLLEPLAPAALTSFTASLFTEVTARAWYLYFDRLGFQPAPRQRIVRMYEGRPFVNISISARLDAKNAGVAPPLLRIDGVERSIIAWEPPGFLASMKVGRGVKKIEETLAALHRELPDIIAKAAAWHQRVVELRWSQAEVLQIMEEIERVGSAAMLPYFAARHNLEVACRRMLQLLDTEAPQASAALIARALGGMKQGVELDMAQRVTVLGKHAADDDSVVNWLRASAFAGWEETLPAGAFADGVRDFMAVYGHRAIGEGEIAVPRWAEAPQSLFAVLRALVEATPEVAAPVEPDISALLAAVDGKARKEAQQLIERMRMLIDLQSGALHAFSYILAGTRRWALAAGREATLDQRLKAVDDVFFYEIEEVKEMMTGEWNISDLSGIHAADDERRAALTKWRQLKPVDLLWGDRKAVATTTALPASLDVADGAVFTLHELTTSSRDGASARRVFIGAAPESAAAIVLPICTAFATADGAVFDPLAASARALGKPGIVACGVDLLKTMSALPVDGDLGKVTIV